jgi:nucleoside-diphosphate kinase
MSNLTFSIIKPDATKRNITGNINSYIEKAGFTIIAQKRIKMTKEKAEKFYEIHKERPFYNDLVSFMTSGPVIIQVLKGEDAVSKYRKIMGATNPVEAETGTIRKDFAINIEQNSVHGSDSNENAKIEIAQFFSNDDMAE